MSDVSLNKIKSVGRQTLNQRVYESVKMSILSGDLLPGTRLSEVQLAKQLNVSPTPVREAFRMLAAEGLVRMEPWKGVEVQSFSQKEVSEVFQCREALEMLALELTFKSFEDKPMDEFELRILDSAIDVAREESSDVTFTVISNSDIHNYWIERSGNKKLAYLMNILDDVLLHDRNKSAYDVKRKAEISEEHITILEAIKEMDLEKAKSALHTHIKNGYEYSKELRENEEK